MDIIKSSIACPCIDAQTVLEKADTEGKNRVKKHKQTQNREFNSQFEEAKSNRQTVC